MTEFGLSHEKLIVRMSIRKKQPIFFPVIQVIVDYAIVVMSVIVAYAVRHLDIVTNIRPILFGEEFSFEYVLRLAYIAGFVWVAALGIAGAYSGRTDGDTRSLLKRVAYGSTIGLFAVLGYFFFTREFFNSRFLLLFFWALGTVLLALGHFITYAMRIHAFSKGTHVRRMLALGPAADVGRIHAYFEANPKHGMRIEAVAEHASEFTEDQLREADGLMAVGGSIEESVLLEMNEFALAWQLDFIYQADPLNMRSEHMYVKTYDVYPFIHFKQTTLEGWGRVWKRVLDIALAIVALIPFAILYIVLAILIKRESPGPVLASLRRVGQGGREFNLYKFRSMIPGAHAQKESLQEKNERADGPLFKLTDDPRVTNIGKFIRAWSIDELGQVINVLKGEMSFVGPRPHEPEEVAQYTNTQKRVLAVKPGITGLPQIFGRSGLSFAEEIKLDTFYLETWTIWLDIRIIVQTPFVLLNRKHAV